MSFATFHPVARRRPPDDARLPADAGRARPRVLPRRREDRGEGGRPPDVVRHVRSSSVTITLGFDPATATSGAFAIDRAVDPALRDPLPPRRRRPLPRARPPDDAPHGLASCSSRAGRRSRSVRGYVAAFLVLETGMLGKPRRARHDPLLRLLGSDARPDVLHHRGLGRQAPHLRHDEVRPLHARRARS